jgi:hypothetical protein
MSDPEAKPMSAIRMRLKKASFRPMKTMPMKATRLTTVTDARITIKSAMASASHAEFIVLFLATRGYVQKKVEQRAWVFLH